MADFEYNMHLPDTEDIEVLYSRIGTAWRTEKNEIVLAKEFDTPITSVRAAIKHHLWLYPEDK